MPDPVMFIVLFILSALAVSCLATFGFMAALEETNIPNRWSALHRWTIGTIGAVCVVILGVL